MTTLHLQTGDIVLFSSPFSVAKPMSWVSLAIRKVAGIKYNHVGVVVNNWGKPFVNEAIETGIESVEAAFRLSKFKGDVRIMRPLKEYCPEQEFAVAANSKVGAVDYDYEGLLWSQLWYQLTSKKMWVGNGKNTAHKRMYCYEYVAWLYRGLFPKWWKIDPDDIINSEELGVVYEGKADELILT